MKTLLTSMAIVALWLSTFGQIENKIEIEWGPIFKDSETIVKLVEQNENGILVLRRSILQSFRLEKNKDYYLQYFNQSLEPVKKELILKEGSGTDRDYFGFAAFKGKLFLFTYIHDNKRKKTYLFAEEIDKKTLKIKGKREIANVAYSKKGGKGFFDISLSKDKSKILIITYFPAKYDENEKFSLLIYDDKFNMIWERNIEMKKRVDEVNIDSTIVSNNGNAFVFIRWYPRSDKERKYQYQTLIYLNNGAKEHIYSLKLENKNIQSIFFSIDSTDKLHVSGYYTVSGSSDIVGTYLQVYDSHNMRILERKDSKLDFSVYYKGISKRKESKRNSYDYLRGFTGYKMISDNNGQYYLLLEQSYRQYNESLRYWHHTDYDILVTKLYDYGRHKWSLRLPKSQVTDGPNGSFILKKIGGTLHLFYNDFKDDSVIHLWIDENGIVNDSRLTTFKESVLWLYTDGYLSNGSQMITWWDKSSQYRSGSKKKRLVRIYFEEN